MTEVYELPARPKEVVDPIALRANYYSEALVHAHALQALGYPVQIVPLDKAELTNRVPNSGADTTETVFSCDDWQKVLYPKALRQYVVPAFTLGGWFNGVESPRVDVLDEHPAKRLISSIEGNYLRSLEEDYVALKSGQLGGEEPYFVRLQHPQPDYPLEMIVGSSAVAALNRIEDARDALLEADMSVDFNEHVLGNHTRELREHGNIARRLRESGVPPINPEQLTGMTVDFYRLVEKIYPDFQKFKELEAA